MTDLEAPNTILSFSTTLSISDSYCRLRWDYPLVPDGALGTNDTRAYLQVPQIQHDQQKQNDGVGERALTSHSFATSPDSCLIPQLPLCRHQQRRRPCLSLDSKLGMPPPKDLSKSEHTEAGKCYRGTIPIAESKGVEEGH